jgi:ribosomal protein S1
MQRAQDLMYQGAVTKGVITGANKGGVIVELEGEAGLRGFMPYTKMAPERLRPGHRGDLSYLVGSPVRAVIVSVDQQAARGPELVLSERQALAADALTRLSPGDVVAGEVTRLEDYGAIVALLNADDGKPMGLNGLVHKKELSWDVVMNVDDAVRVGQRVQVKVMGVDAARRNVSLSLRALQQDPLTETIESIEWRDTSEVRIICMSDS